MMKIKYWHFLTILLFLVINCVEREADNPYDPESSPEIWKPQGLKTSISGQMTVTLSWTMSTNQYDKVCIDRIRQGGEVEEKIASVPKSASQWTDNTLIPDKNRPYEYLVYAVAGSNESSRVSIAYTPDVPTPKNLNVQKVSEQKYQVQWDSEERGKNILERKKGEDTWIVINDNISANTSGNGYLDETVPLNQSVSYRVCLIVEGVQSAYSESQVVATVLNGPDQLATPVIDDSKIQLQWQDNSETEEGFRIYRKSGTDTWNLLSEQKVQNLNTFTDNSIPLENRIYYRISSFYHDAESFSGEVYVDPDKPTAETGIVVDIYENSAICKENKVPAINRSALTAKGLVWGKSTDPTLDNKVGFTNNGTLKQPFTAAMTDLESNTQYYVRAYATNGKGTSYGVVQPFKTKETDTRPPKIVAFSPSGLTVINPTLMITFDEPIELLGGFVIIYKVTSPTPVRAIPHSSMSLTGKVLTIQNIGNLEYGEAYYVKVNGSLVQDLSGNLFTGINDNTTWTFQVQSVKPTVITGSYENVTINSARIHGKVDSNGGANISEHGFYYGKTTGNMSKFPGTIIETPEGFYADLTDLEPGTTYYYKAFASNINGSEYGEIDSFPTHSVIQPSVTTGIVTGPACNSVTLKGTVTSTGGESITITECGFYYGTSSSSMNTKVTTSTTTSFYKTISVSEQTTYYYKAYAVNSAGLTGFGNVESFTTPKCAVAPTVTTFTTTATSSTTASSGGIVTSPGGIGITITARGVCWSTSQNPTIANNKTTDEPDGDGSISFNSSITGLSSCTTYYIRAYATNSAGLTGYGGISSFTTNCIGVPTVTTATVTSITTNSASGGGNVTNDGGATVTARGVCWSTSPNPTVSLSTKTVDGSGTGPFTSSLTGLSPGTKYYVRAYSTNSAGTGYGSERNFTTEPVQNDFYISNATVSATTVAPEEEFSVSCDQKYNGNSTSPLDVYVGYYLSTNTSWDSNDIKLGEDSSNLDVSDSSDGESASLTLPRGPYSGIYYILFVADYKKEYNETNENNNVSYKQITVSSETTKTFYALADALVFNKVPDTNYGDNESNVILNSSDGIAYFYIKFDLSIIRLDAVIKQAKLRLYVSDVSNSYQIKINRVISSWSESTITWNRQPSSSAQVSVTKNFSSAKNIWVEFDVENFVDIWKSNPGINHGMLLESLNTTNEIRIDSKETSNKPQLIITYD